jgi:UDP-3-O-[3-hydroxymyristoyl] glucosamine N-acyltransferase
MKLSEVARALHVDLSGDPDIEITGVAGLEEAEPGHLSFLSNPKYASLLKTTRASAVILTKDAAEQTRPVLRSNNPYLTFARAIDLFYRAPEPAVGIHSTAVVSATAKVGKNASIGPYVVIQEDVTIGDDAVIHPHVVIYPHARIGDRFLAHAHAVVREHCVLGDDVTLQNGAIIGADGFGFAPDHTQQGAWQKITQSGHTVLEDRVEVQANGCVDRASIGETRIGRGSKIDNLVQVGHGSRVGEHTLLCAQVGLAGSTKVGNKVILAGQVGVAGHCHIGDNVIATAQTGIPNDVESGKVVSGYPAIENRQWLRSVAIFNKLPEIVRELRTLSRSRKPE